MKKRISFRSSVLLAVTTIALTFLSIPARAAVTLLDKDEWKMQLGGFAELDMMNDSTRSYTETAGSGPVARPGTLAGDNGRTQFSPRNSRFSFAVMPPVQSDWKTKGYLEFDLFGFTNLPTEAKAYAHPDLRLRHAYLSAEKDGWQILAGQTWSLFGWQTYYMSPTVSVPPVAGVTYERNSQLLLMKTMDSLQAAISIFRPIQADSQLPGLDAGIRWSFDGWKTGFTNSPTGEVTVQPLSIAVTGTARDFEFAGTGSTTAKTDYAAYGVAADAMIPILPASGNKDLGNSLAIVGEFTTGQGYGDMFPNWSGNVLVPKGTNLDPGLGGTSASGAVQLVQLTTFNLNLQYQLPGDLQTYINAGYGQINSNNSGSLGATAGNTTYTKSEDYFVNVYHNFTNQIRAALEYAYFDTTYSDGVIAHNNRVQVSTWYRF